jgi:hypothetical protein
MSYSLSETAESKEEVLLLAKTYYENNVVTYQAIHEKDKAESFLAWEQALSLLPEIAEGQAYVLSAQGFVSTTNGKITNVSISTQVSIITKPQE